MNKLRIFKYVFVVVAFCLIVALVIIITKNIKIEKKQENIKTINETEEEDYYHGYDISDDYEAFNDRFIENVYGLKDLSDEEKEQLKYYGKNEFEFILKMMQPNQNWNTFPISKELRAKLNNEVREVAKYNFDKVEFSNETLNDLEEYGSVGQFQVIGTKDKIRIMFTFQISTNFFAIQEFALLKEQVIQDEKGSEVDNRLIFDDKNWEEAIDIISARPYNENIKQVAVTDNFLSKYNSLYDAFVKIIKPEKVSDYIGFAGNDFLNNSTVDYTWWNDGEERTYRVKFILDDKSYIDDVEITPLD